MGRTFDRQEVEALFRQHAPTIHRRALRILGNRAEAEEATQEVFIRAMNGTFHGERDPVAWLYRITTNYCLNKVRDRTRRRELLEEHVVPSAPESGPSAEDLVLLRRLLQEADPRQAQAAVYVYMDGLSYNEAAETMGVARRTVCNLLERFRAWAAKRAQEATP